MSKPAFKPVPVRSYSELIASIDQVRQLRGFSMEELNERAGFSDRYVSHLIGWQGKSGRCLLTPLGLDLMLETLGVRILIAEDPETAPKVQPYKFARRDLYRRIDLEGILKERAAA